MLEKNGFIGYDIPKISLFNNENFIIQPSAKVLPRACCRSLGRSFILTEILNYSIRAVMEGKLWPALAVQGNEAHAAGTGSSNLITANIKTQVAPKFVGFGFFFLSEHWG